MRPRWPAPASTTTSTLARPSLWTTSGTMATRRSPCAVSFGTPNFMRRGRVPIDSSVGRLPRGVGLPIELRADAHRAQPGVGLVDASRVPDGEGEPCRRRQCLGDLEEERHDRDGGEQHRAAAPADLDLAALAV